MKICKDPRHDTPCPNPETCPACQMECNLKYWVETTTFYQCQNCGCLSEEKGYCHACTDTHQKKLGDFKDVNEAYIFASERAGGFYGSLPKQGDD